MSCRYNLYLDVKPNGSVRLNFPDLEPHELRVSCALDVANHGGLDVTHTAQFLNISRERLRQIEAELMAKLRDAAAEGDRSMARALLELWGDE